MYAYLSLWIDCGNFQENLDLDLFWAGNGRFCGVFRHFVFRRHGTRLATFCIEPKNCIFWGASFEPFKHLATLVPEKLQGFHGTHLYHCYTLTLAIRLMDGMQQTVETLYSYLRLSQSFYLKTVSGYHKKTEAEDNFFWHCETYWLLFSSCWYRQFPKNSDLTPRVEFSKNEW